MVIGEGAVVEVGVGAVVGKGVVVELGNSTVLVVSIGGGGMAAAGSRAGNELCVSLVCVGSKTMAAP